MLVPRVPAVGWQHVLDSSDPCDDPGLRLALGQAWLPRPNPALQIGTARISVAQDALVAVATLADTHVVTSATDDHQLFWELGDVFEIFLQAVGRDDYFEFQISPRGHVLQLHYPHRHADRTQGIATYIQRERLIDHTARIDAPARRWHAAARIPLCRLVSIPSSPALPVEWQVACCRYDYDAAGTFTFSSTAPLSRPDFHRIAEWTHITLSPDLPA